MLEYVRASSDVTLISHQSAPFHIGFLPNLTFEICEKFNVQETFIDSTFKTNAEKFELFAVIGKVVGTGFPLAYFLLGSGDTRFENAQNSFPKTSLEQFLLSLKREVPGINRKFFFSDKDFAQLEAIKEAFNVTPSLCLWHVKRAIIQKFKDLRKHESRVTFFL